MDHELADSDDSDKEVTSTTLLADDLMAFQHDLTSLRKLAHSLRAAMPRVTPQTFFVVLE